MLTRLGNGDKVFTNSMTEDMWNLLSNPTAWLAQNMPTVATLPITMGESDTASNVTLQIDNVTMNGVNDPSQFVANLKMAVKTDANVQKQLKELTIGSLSSKSNSLGIRKY